MIKLFISILLIIGISISNSSANQLPPRPWEDCLSLAPFGFPQTNITPSHQICRHGYALLHDNRARLAAWVAYTLSKEQTLGCLLRQDSFESDQSLPKIYRSELSDYRKSGYDMGHLAPNADLSWNPQVQRESFLLSNIAPQLPGLNRGLWRELESIIRGWAYNLGSLTIYTGSVYDVLGPRLQNRVVIPYAFYKIVINNKTNETLAFLFPHQSDLGGEIAAVQTTVETIEGYTGIQFPTPDAKNIRRPIWPVNTRALAQARASVCKK